MKINFSYLVFLCLSFNASSQNLQIENVGNPPMSTPVSSYTGWANQGNLTFKGTAEVQSLEPSNNIFSSGGGNVFFTNTIGTSFQIIGLPTYEQPNAVEIAFNMFGYDTANPNNLNELLLSVSIDSGTTWSPLPYERSWYFGTPQPWDYFTAIIYDTINHKLINVGRLSYRFTQSSTTRSFRIDDINLKFIQLFPIKLNYFNFVPRSGKAILRWNAASSSNKEFFIVEKSEDCVHFYPIEKRYAKGNGEYDYEHVDDIKNKSFYRLALKNADGSSSYSRTILINSTSTEKKLIEVIFPIPAKDVLTVQINQPAEQETYLSIADATGKLRMQKMLNLIEGINNCELNIQYLEAGVYYMTVSNSQNKETKKIIVSK